MADDPQQPEVPSETPNDTFSPPSPEVSATQTPISDAPPASFEEPAPEKVPEGTQTPFGAPSPEIPETPVPVPKGNRTALIATIIVLGVLVLGVGGYFAYTYFFGDKPSTTSQPSQNTPPPVSGTLNAITDSIKEKISGTIEASYDPSQGSDYRVTGTTAYVKPDEGAQSSGVDATYSTKATFDTDVATVKEILTENNFTLTLEGQGVPVDFYQSSDIACEFNHNDFSLTLGVTCNSVTDYQKSIEEYRPFITAYFKNTEKSSPNVSFGEITIKDSPTVGYQTAYIDMYPVGFGVGGFSGAFYNTPDGIWHYLRGSQDTIGCSDYNTSDARTAFEGKQCYDSSTDSLTTVKK